MRDRVENPLGFSQITLIPINGRQVSFLLLKLLLSNVYLSTMSRSFVIIIKLSQFHLKTVIFNNVNVRVAPSIQTEY